MESNKNKTIDQVIRDGIEKSESHYAAEADKAKGRIWDAIEHSQEEEKATVAPTIPFWPRVAKIAAAIALLVAFSLTYLTVQQKDTEIAEMKREMENLRRTVAFEDTQAHEKQDGIAQAYGAQEANEEAVQIIRDTIYITQVKEIYKVENEVETVTKAPEQVVALVQPIAPDLKVDKRPLIGDEKLFVKQIFAKEASAVAAHPNKDRKNQRAIKFSIAHPAASKTESSILSLNIKL